MCLAIPAKIIELDDDLVLVHAGFAISLVNEAEAKETWDLIDQINKIQDTDNKLSG